MPAGYDRRMPAAPTLTAEQIAFVCGPCSIYAAAFDAERRPAMSRALGCEVGSDRRSLTVLLHPRQAAAVLAYAAQSGRIAVVFSDTLTNQTLQLKGEDARCVEASPDAQATVLAHIESFIGQVEPLGFGRQLTHGLVRGSPEAAVALQFTISSAFEQTPGPAAGARL